MPARLRLFLTRAPVEGREPAIEQGENRRARAAGCTPAHGIRPDGIGTFPECMRPEVESVGERHHTCGT